MIILELLILIYFDFKERITLAKYGLTKNETFARARHPSENIDN